MVLPHDEMGTGPAVVLLHAGVADRTMWSELLPSIAAAGHRALAFDLPGFGEADGDGFASPWSAVLASMDALDVEQAAFIGSSFGGAVALRVAAVAPGRVTRLALVSAPAPNLEPSAQLEAAWEAEESALERGDIEAAVAAVVDTWTAPDASPELRRRVAAMQRRAFEIQAEAADVPEPDDPLEPDSSALDTLQMAALVAVGELDMPDFRRGAEMLAQQLPAARLVVISGAGHLAPLEQPESFRDLIMDHLLEG